MSGSELQANRPATEKAVGRTFATGVMAELGLINGRSVLSDTDVR